MAHVPPVAVPVLGSRLGRTPWLAAFALLLSACGAPGPTPGLQLSLGSASVAVVRGTTAEVPVTLTRVGGAAGSVDLSIAGLPANVTATFTPATLDGGTLTSTLRISAGAAASEGATALTVVATGGTLSDDAALSLDVQSLTVVGHVQAVLNRPLVGATVTSQGKTAYTDASGGFTLAGLSVPYDLTVSSALGGGNLHVYEGMTSPTPTVRPTFAALGSPGVTHTATITGSITGGALGLGEVARVCIEGLAVPVYGCDTVVAGETDYAISAAWFDGALTSVRLHAFHAEIDGDGLASAYLGYATVLVNLVDGDVTLADLDFGPVDAATLSGTTARPASLPNATLLVSVRFGTQLSLPLFQIADPGDDYQALVPELPGVSYDVILVASGIGGPVVTWKRAVGLDAGDLVVSEPAQLTTPADGEPGVDLTTPFGTTPAGGAITYLWGPDGAGPFMALTTTRSPATIPDPASVGFPYPSSLDYSWGILGHGDADVDEAAAGGYGDFFIASLYFGGEGGPGFDAERTYGANTTGRDFTFGP